MSEAHLHDELAHNPARVLVNTRYGLVVGGRASNEAVVFLGNLFISAGLLIMCPDKFNDFQKFRMHYLQDDLKTLSLYQMIIDMNSRITFRSLHVSIHSVHFVLTINFRQRAIDATQPSNDGQAQGNIWSTFWEHLLKFFYGGPFEDRVGFGKPSENPYVTDCLSM